MGDGSLESRDAEHAALAPELFLMKIFDRSRCLCLVHRCLGNRRRRRYRKLIGLLGIDYDSCFMISRQRLKHQLTQNSDIASVSI